MASTSSFPPFPLFTAPSPSTADHSKAPGCASAGPFEHNCLFLVPAQVLTVLVSRPPLPSQETLKIQQRFMEILQARNNAVVAANAQLELHVRAEQRAWSDKLVDIREGFATPD